ncbi:MAG: SufS family cysteine desulfurase, partial [Planctomycetota bacterium]
MSTSAAAAPPHASLLAARADFPALREPVRGQPLVYLDSAASALKPDVVIERLRRFYSTESANIHRGVHYLSEVSTRLYEEARARVQRFLGAKSSGEIIFTRGTTEGINLVAHCFARPRLAEGDRILVTALEHHANIVPWQMACEATGAELSVLPMSDEGELLLDELDALLTDRTRLFAINHISNALGTVNPVKELIRRARERGIPTLVDGAQAVPHQPVDVNDLGCDFYVFSGHKLYGPTGIGALFGKHEHLSAMPPYQGGGDMIRSVTFEKTTYADPPARFEAGTPHIAGAIGLAAAIDYVDGLGLDAIAAHEGSLLRATEAALEELGGVQILGRAQRKAGVVSFAVDGVHPHDVGTIVDSQGVAIRAGHHCAQPIMDRLGVTATARASFGLYNNLEDVAALA